MKRTPLVRKTPLKRFSLKARRKQRDRVKCIAVVHERDRQCQFWVRLMAWRIPYVIDPALDVPDCGGPFDVHEPRKRSQGADPTNPDDCVLVCRVHHDYLHTHPWVGEALGLLLRNGRTVTPWPFDDFDEIEADCT